MISDKFFLKRSGFTLIELLVVVAIIGILAAVGLNTFTGFQEKTKVAATKANFQNTVKYFTIEATKCSIDSSEKIFGGLDCPLKAHWHYQACSAIYLSWKYNLRNPNLAKEAAGWKAGSGLPCATLVTGDRGSLRGGVRSGDGQQDGDVNIVICPRSPYCGNEAAGKFKIMWWWDEIKMQDYKIIDPNSF